MSETDPRADSLRAFETCARDFSSHLTGRFETGAELASRDIGRLSAFADRLSESILSWRAALAELEAGAADAIDPGTAARRLIESVFDDLLIPEASRVLSSALDLAWMNA